MLTRSRKRLSPVHLQQTNGPPQAALIITCACITIRAPTSSSTCATSDSACLIHTWQAKKPSFFFLSGSKLPPVTRDAEICAAVSDVGADMR